MVIWQTVWRRQAFGVQENVWYIIVFIIIIIIIINFVIIVLPYYDYAIIAKQIVLGVWVQYFTFENSWRLENRSRWIKWASYGDRSL